jgi:hypothetical protein
MQKRLGDYGVICRWRMLDDEAVGAATDVTD